METNKSLDYYRSEQALHGSKFDREACLEDIHRMWGESVAEAVESITSDWPATQEIKS